MDEEKWVYSYDVETKKSLLTMGLKNLSKNQKTTASSVKCEGDVHCVFLFVYGGVVHIEF
jgi:hypothetical protein